MESENDDLCFSYRGRYGEDLMLQATSYEVREPSGWIAQVHVWETVYEAGSDVSRVTPFWPHASHRFANEQLANDAALRGTARWIDQGRPPVPRVG